MKTRISLLGPLALAVMLAPAAGAARTSAVPPALVGTWTRTVTAADVKRVHATYPVHAGMACTLTVRKVGVLNAAVICTGGQKGGFKGTIDVAGPDRVHINLSESVPNVYRWQVSGSRLTFTKVKDPFANRVAVFWGVWQRQG